MAIASGYYQSIPVGQTYTINPNSPTTPTPTFSLGSGTYSGTQTVTIHDSLTGALPIILYTTDGTTPTAFSAFFSTPITISSSQTLKAIARAAGYLDSAVASATYTINGQTPAAAAPVFSLPAGTYASAQSVTISDATPGATIYYTTDGTTPTITSHQYAGAITISSTLTLQAIAVASNYANSAVASAVYTFAAATPDFAVTATPNSLSITAGQSAATSLVITPLNGFQSNVSFACSGLPSGSSCSFSPGPAAASPYQGISLTITVPPTTARLDRNFNPLLPESVLAAMLCFFGFSKKRRISTVFLLPLVAGVLTLLTGCTTKTAQTNSPGLSIVTVTASAGTLLHTTTVSLSVN